MMCAKGTKPTIVGAGMVTRDHIYRDDKFEFTCVGGTCGNVVSYAAALGCECYLVSRIGNDEAGSHVLAEMSRLGVHMDFVALEDRGTPNILGRVSTTSDPPRHKYEFRCPDTGAYFPRFRSPTLKQVEEVGEAIWKPDLFYCDRLTDSILELLFQYAARGVAVMVEPSDTASAHRVKDLAGAVTILKASAEHLGLDHSGWSESGAKLRIVTLGQEGVGFSTALSPASQDGQPARSWEFLAPRYKTPVVDTIGAGDAFSGALISNLFGRSRPLGLTSYPRIHDAVKAAQHVAEYSCRGAGPRWLLDGASLASNDLSRRVYSVTASGQ